MSVRPVPAHAARPWVGLLCLAMLGCSGFVTSVGGGMTPVLRRDGVAARAVILQIWETGWTINDSPVIGMKVRVQPADRPDFEATIEKTTISLLAIPQFQPGNVIPVRFDPRNPASVAVDPEGSIAAASAASSGNPYRDRFERADLEGAVFLPPPAEPRLYLGTADLATDIRTLFENGYALLGGAAVWNAADPRLAVDQGRAIGAALVVVYGRFATPAGMALDVLPFPRRAAHPAAPAGGASASFDASRFVSGSLGPEDQFATYWGETRPAILGIVSRPLDQDEQVRFERRDGIVVETVSIGSPAAAAGIAIGDLLIAIDGRPIPDGRAVPELLASLAGREVRIDLIRAGRAASVTAVLNPATP